MNKKREYERTNAIINNNYHAMRVQTSCIIAVLTGEQIPVNKIYPLEGDIQAERKPISTERINHLIQAWAK